MPRVHHVKKAQKDNPAAGIKKGESYFWWANRRPGARSGVKRYSKTRPRPSQVTASEYYSQAYALQESVEDALEGCKTVEDVEGLFGDLESAADESESLGSEQEEKLNNMPEGFQQGSTGELLQARSDACQTVADTLRDAASELEGKPWEDDGDNIDGETAFDKAFRHASDIIANLSWDWDG